MMRKNLFLDFQFLFCRNETTCFLVNKVYKTKRKAHGEIKYNRKVKEADYPPNTLNSTLQWDIIEAETDLLSTLSAPCF